MNLSVQILFFLCSLAAIVQSQDEHLCNFDCVNSFQQIFSAESPNWVDPRITNNAFYDTSLNGSANKPGDLLKWEDIPPAELSTNWTIPGGMSFSRFIYVTEDIDGSPLPASAFALLPYAQQKQNQPLNTIVWTHGTTGRARTCAPSNHKALAYEWEGPFALAQAGYAVIAPDYTGLGTKISQGFMYEAGYLHAGDAIFSLIAARKVLGALLSDSYVVVGHSEGGLTAWRTNERLARPDQSALTHAGRFLGSVAGGPALRPLSLIPESFRIAAGGPVGDVVSVYVLQSLARLFPEDLVVEEYFSDKVLARIPLADSSCLLSGYALFGTLTQVELYKNISWLEHPKVVDWQARYNGAGPHALAGPMLVVQGAADEVVYASFIEKDFNSTCRSFPDSRAEMLLYPGLDHDVSFQAGQVDYLSWIAARFSGVDAEQACVVKTVRPATDRFGTNQIGWTQVPQS